MDYYIFDFLNFFYKLRLKTYFKKNSDKYSY
jgi:hypothetical protein